MDSLTLTIIGILLLSGIIAFIRGRVRDRCLKNFRRDPVIIEQVGGKCIHGKLEVECTGLELIYENPHLDDDGHAERRENGRHTQELEGSSQHHERGYESDAGYAADQDNVGRYNEASAPDLNDQEYGRQNQIVG